jgi:transposase
MSETITRYIGLDIHKAYVVAVGVDPRRDVVLGPTRLTWAQFGAWSKTHLTLQDAIVVEMTTNTWEVYDLLQPQVHSVTVVHPPHVALVTRAQVKTDRKAAQALAELHAAGLLVSIWVPPQTVRDQRTLIAQRTKMVRLATTAKNRLHSALHRHHLAAPPGSQPFIAKQKDFWLKLPVSAVERAAIACDWATIEFATQQQRQLESALAEAAAHDERVPLLIQLPGIGLINAMTILGAIGPIERFPSSEQLVGYSGLGSRVHISGELHSTGRITKAGRRDLRSAMIQAAQHAVRANGHWKAEFERLEPRLGRGKTIVAIARKLLTVVWHVLSKQTVDRFAEPQQVACALFAHAYKVGIKNLPDGQSALQFTRQQLDRLQIGTAVSDIPWGRKTFKLPPSRLAT